MKERFDIDTIAKYIVKNYPESCLARNGGYGDTQTCEAFFYYEKLNWCGCGNPEAVKREIMKYFSLLDWWHDDQKGDTSDEENFHNLYIEYNRRFFEAFGVHNVYENPLLLSLAYAMDAAGFTDHGSSIGGAWLTREGEMFLYLLQHDDELVEEEEE